ncbi:MAG: helix-turn-helix transcriptional regulator [Candidatus Bathyarchaeota archaeon]|nr:helix-turn-helix transcriptional regulator [Candidatus Bathyarchaeota archaeon]MDP6459102.1 helix-turn-helix transcriptional regulator [Candidatus Bathyarchaeota archaeon]MDP7207205.1 helix-turn-helix transcriptional regulator [Candidatus Bathyarchaeota archaeon]MDP7443352.1 helix-turn-helix transcriptional regulator [Candidatus Bathyarchaeota archaeon]
MVKPKGSTGTTKMKIMAIIDYNYDNGADSYGYTIWQSLKNHFHIYLTNSDVRNVYHHLRELTDLGYLTKEDEKLDDPSKRCLYALTEDGKGIESRYSPYLDIVRRSSGPARKY